MKKRKIKIKNLKRGEKDESGNKKDERVKQRNEEKI